MPLFRKLSDQEEYEKIERETQRRMNKFFDKVDGSNDYPGESYLLRKDNINASEFEKINHDSGRINIEYVVNMGFFVRDRLRVRIEVYHIGSILCTGIKNIKEIPQIKKSNIQVSFLFKNKSI
jgi:hypothetical protein